MLTQNRFQKIDFLFLYRISRNLFPLSVTKMFKKDTTVGAVLDNLFGFIDYGAQVLDLLPLPEVSTSLMLPSRSTPCAVFAKVLKSKILALNEFFFHGPLRFSS